MATPISSTVSIDSTSGSPARSAGLLENASSMWQELAGLAHERLHLAALETRLAGENLVVIIAALFRGMMPPLRLIPAKAA